jgi:4-hydroxybenzoate polyprenyltransferase
MRLDMFMPVVSLARERCIRMSRPVQILLLVLGALAVLVVVNWARHQIVVGLIAACLIAVAAVLLARAENVAGGDER